MQRSPTNLILCIHIRTCGDVLFEGFDVSYCGSIVN